jgi:ubiquinone/menaquinone biosynthesis C-methylase UbiE
MSAFFDALDWVARLSPFSRNLPHFVTDHRAQARALALTLGTEAGVRRAIGGEFEAFGRIELALLRNLGLSEQSFIVDVGCGSGRLANALTANMPQVRYHGTDVVRQFLKYARSISPAHFRFSLVKGLTIPEKDSVADFVVFFSVGTHLAHHETYRYLQEARRITKPGGLIVMSFLQFTIPGHWKNFENVLANTTSNFRAPINAFIEPEVFRVWSKHLGLELEKIIPGNQKQIPLTEPIQFENGSRQEGMASFGQSVAVMRKPAS